MKGSVVHIDPEILGGTPVFVGTRVPVKALLDFEAGHPLDEFLDDFPSVSRARLRRSRRPSGIWNPVRVLLDECVPRNLRRELPGHEVRTGMEMGWAGTRNGLLLRQAAAEFDAFLTVDQGVEFQQHLVGVDLAVIVMAAPSNKIEDLRPLMPRVLAAISSTSAGEIAAVRA